MVVFENEGEIDLRLVTTFGVCDKVGSNPIGYFGTGLKYAIAVFLREKATIVLWRGLERYEFYTRRQKLRTTEAEWIVMKGPRSEHVLAFTTDLGKNWAPWQAFRELICNTLDEGGRYYRVDRNSAQHLPAKGWTRIELEGPGVDELYARRGTIILSTEPLFKSPVCEIHEGDGTWLYYRGIRVHKNEKPALYNYNIIAEQTLTEDRTLRDVWGAHYAIARAVTQCEDREVVDSILRAPKERMEHDINFEYTAPSPTFIERVRHHSLTFVDINPTAFGSCIRTAHGGEWIPTKAPTEAQQETIDGVYKVLQRMGIPIDPVLHQIKISALQHVDGEVAGRALLNTIYLNEWVLERGFVETAATVLTCFLKIKYQLDPGTMATHNWLVNFLITSWLGQDETDFQAGSTKDTQPSISILTGGNDGN